MNKDMKFIKKILSTKQNLHTKWHFKNTTPKVEYDTGGK